MTTLDSGTGEDIGQQYYFHVAKNAANVYSDNVQTNPIGSGRVVDQDLDEGSLGRSLPVSIPGLLPVAHKQRLEKDDYLKV